jgi:uncharacterized YccA/Bax inhibitor family protein
LTVYSVIGLIFEIINIDYFYKTMKSSNPTLSKKIFENYSFSATAAQTMTVQGTVNKIALMLAIVVASAAFTWSKFFGAKVLLLLPFLDGWLWVQSVA